MKEKGVIQGVLWWDEIIAIRQLNIRKNIFAYLFSVHNTISLSRHEQVCLMRLRFTRFTSLERSISRNVASLNTLVHDVINLLYYNIRQLKMPIISAKDNENNRWKRKTKNKDRKEQRGDGNRSKSVRSKWCCCAFRFSPINM